jgi:hypothetical protein
VIKHFLWTIGGAVAFWSPIVVVFAAGRTNANLVAANVLAVVGILLCFVVRRRFYPLEHQSLWMLAGIYFYGPPLLSTATTFANGGFAQMHGWSDVGWLLFACVFPPIQLLLAATSGLLPSVLLATIILGAASVIELSPTTGKQ